MSVPRLVATIILGLCTPHAVAATAFAQIVPPVAAPAVPQAVPGVQPIGSKWWLVAGGGFSMVRAGCEMCGRAGVFTNSKGIFFDVGGRVTPRVDFGVEVLFVTAHLEESVDSDPVRTTFIVGVAQFRPLMDRGLYFRAGMGVGFAGLLDSAIRPDLAETYSTNALGVTYGLGWIFRHEHRWGTQANFSHHIAAIGELSSQSGEPVRNVVGNYWTSGVAIFFR